MGNKRWHRKGRVCACGSLVSDYSKTGLCRPCFMTKLHSDPERARKTGETLRRKMREDPEHRRKVMAGAQKGRATRMANPEWRANSAKAMREKVQPLAVAAKVWEKYDFDALRAKALEARWAWCPVEYRPLAKELMAKKTFTSAEVRSMVKNQIAHDEAKLSPFERQERALQRGAKLVANDARPSLGSPGDFGEARWTHGKVA